MWFIPSLLLIQQLIYIIAMTPNLNIKQNNTY